MHKTKSKAFTLIELIIVIAIIAILAVTAFLVLTKWMGKSRDSRRVNDISAINSALQIYTSDASLLPLPDSYSGVYDTGYALAWYQGSFTDNIASQLSNISKNIKDPQGSNYGYSVTYDRKQYQLRALTESTVSYQNNIINQVYAASQTAKMQGNYAGFVVTATGSLHSLWNVPSLFLFTGTAIISGTQFTGGNNNFLQDNKTTDNIYPVAIVDVSNLYNSSTSDDAAVYTNIINTYSGTNNITTSSGATAVVQSAAGGVTLLNSTSVGIGGNDSYTKLLLHFDNNLIDSSSNNFAVTNNNSVTFSNTINKFGGYGASFNGSNSYLSLSNSADWNFGLSDFTIDFWIKPCSTSSMEILSKRPDGTVMYIAMAIYSSQYTIFLGGINWGGGTAFGAVDINQWTHIAIVRNGNTFYLFKNGILGASLSSANTITIDSSLLEIGRDRVGLGYLNGYLDELRISKGIARRTANFTPPTAPYSN